MQDVHLCLFTVDISILGASADGMVTLKVITLPLAITAENMLHLGGIFHQKFL